MEKDKPFLVTTAIEDFWDTSYPIVFLGEWCKRYSRKRSWEKVASETMPSYFEENKSGNIYSYLNNVFERLLVVLHKQMNQIHGVDFSIRYWRIIFGAWLISYVHVIYDRYKNIEHFISLYPDFTSICLDSKCFVIPKDVIHFNCQLKNDDFNLQIYSSILAELDYKLPTRELTVSVPDVSVYFTEKSKWFKNILKNIYKLTSKIFQNKQQVFLRNSYFSNWALFKLILKTKGAVWPCIHGYKDLPDYQADYGAREALGKLDFGENEFEKMLVTLLPLYMPQSMVEGFSFLRKQAKNDFISEPKAIMSAISWWFDNTFRAWAAESVEKGTMLLGVQHGGNYGIAANLLQSDIELSIVDKFYSWGWEFCDNYAKVIPMPAPKLVGKKIKSPRGRKGVLYVLSSCARYSYQIPWSVNYWQDYFVNQTLFMSHLSESVANRLRLRPYKEDLGWDLRDRIKDSFPQIKIEDWDVAFSDSLRDCSVYVCDHPLCSTTFIEALSNNKPTIIFYNPNFAANAVRDEVEELFEQLKENSVIFDDPIKAARHLNSVYGCIESWWNEPKRQAAVRSFLDRHGKTSPTWLQDWSEEILSIAKNGDKRGIV